MGWQISSVLLLPAAVQKVAVRNFSSALLCAAAALHRKIEVDVASCVVVGDFFACLNVTASDYRLAAGPPGIGVAGVVSFT